MSNHIGSDGWLESPYTGLEPDEEDCTCWHRHNEGFCAKCGGPCYMHDNFPCPVHEPGEFEDAMREEAQIRKWEERRENGLQ